MAAAAVSVTPLDMCYVLYEEGNLFEEGLAHLTLTPMYMVVAVLAVIAATRRLEAVYFLVGLLVDTILAVIIKRIVREPRPPGSYKGGYGMPSNHAQFVSFFAVFVSIALLRGRVRLVKPPHVRWPAVLCSAVTVAVSGLTCYSRVRLGMHSERQVVIGAGLGVVLACLWEVLGDVMVRPHLMPSLAASPLGAFFLLRHKEERTKNK